MSETRAYGQSTNQHRRGSNQTVKLATAVTAGGSLMVLSGLTLAGTIIALTLVTPLLVIFSPVLVPATITVSLITAGFVTSGGLGTAAVTVFSWMYKYMTTGKQPAAGAGQLGLTQLKAREMRERVEHGEHEVDIED